MTDPIEALDAAPMSAAQVRAVAVTGILSALDGYDVLAMTFAAPGISDAWGIDKAALGLTLSSGLVGMALGSLLLAPLGDRWGRRRVALISLVLMIIGMLAASFAASIATLAVWRVVTGIGIGAMVPIIAPLAAEYANARRRRLAMAIMSIGYPVGGTVGGFAAAFLLSRFDWPSVFLFGGILSLLMLGPVIWWLPEPPAFLLARRAPDALPRLNAYLTRCGHMPLAALPEQPVPAGQRSGYQEIFSTGRRSDTVAITLSNLLFIMTVYYILSWMPQLVVDLGHTPAFATLVSSLACLSGVITCIAVGLAGRCVPLRWLVAGQMAGLSLASVLFGFSPADAVILLTLAAIVGACLYSGIVGLYSAIVDTFDPRMRTTGVGFVMGVGRAAGAIAPALAGWLFAAGAGRETVTAILALGSLAAALLILTNRRRYAI